MDPQSHWEHVYRTKALHEVSWTQSSCDRSLAFVEATGIATGEPILDAGGGASVFVDQLLARGYSSITVLDLSPTALAVAKARLGERAARVTWLERDVTRDPLPGTYAVWHDRAVFHFLTDPQDRRRYLGALRQALRPGGHLILSTFAKDGPTRCSGLEVCRYDCEDMMAELPPEFRLLDRARESHVTPFQTVQEFCYGFFRYEGG